MRAHERRLERTRPVDAEESLVFRDVRPLLRIEQDCITEVSASARSGVRQRNGVRLRVYAKRSVRSARQRHGLSPLPLRVGADLLRDGGTDRVAVRVLHLYRQLDILVRREAASLEDGLGRLAHYVAAVLEARRLAVEGWLSRRTLGEKRNDRNRRDFHFASLLNFTIAMREGEYATIQSPSTATAV